MGKISIIIIIGGDFVDKLAIGLMSGTSLDGIDVCLAKIKGVNESTKIKFLDGITVPWSLRARKMIADALDLKRSNIKLISQLNFLIAHEYKGAILKLLKNNNLKFNNLSYIASHGQTVWHDPHDEKNPSTFQIGSGAVLSALTKTTVVANFRLQDLALGGEGAPLVPFFDELFFKAKKGLISLHNIGGISNLSLLNNGKLEIAFDTGPGNMIIDFYAHKLFNLNYDDKGTIASKGNLIKPLYNEVLSLNYFNLEPPKSTGRELFGNHYANYLLTKYPHFKKEDYLYTATKITIETIYDSYRKLIATYGDLKEIIFSGGGAHNDFILTSLSQKLPHVKIKKSSDYQLSIDYKEALAFIVLANQTLHQQPSNMPKATKAKGKVILGEISYYRESD
ncbi:MAG: anhydro-N-acetylmuramic acid kinase [Acholeplasmatales bacterium]|jgi:anhydro-N-acetylmuramic acid kinase|nr:anhydro-N-acetylmuramic acid kinase [Acholeplasmataceae bacterium]MCK9233725.1 anhydro-N-acetylmuramic acid kinase [Acholeplasmataceae bacterium]MCK9289535.1 anhydro-N-acetylmuramic acid kinase [Acholeplasmataceae bacterium]MCK9427587.1 anhydro-N-acetylmuramic acid kinase [Acholeplasmataceae bacterium]MDY0115424.1 anhydro-N-acetylmuramic acid kinase [Acholeplasmatales bacterium]